MANIMMDILCPDGEPFREHLPGGGGGGGELIAVFTQLLIGYLRYNEKGLQTGAAIRLPVGKERLHDEPKGCLHRRLLM